MTRTAINIFGLQNWFGGDLVPVIDLIRIADKKGVYQVDIAEHMTMGEATDKYPYGSYPVPMETPWYEPIAMLSAFAAATEHIRLTTGILISPLRSAGLLAKQLSTLHFLSRGRVDIGFGVGWQEAEYQICDIPFEGRFGRMMEIARACRELWSKAPASFHGDHVNFDRKYSYPLLDDPNAIRFWFGLTDTPRNVERIAELGDGWIPMVNDPGELAISIDHFRTALALRGRDPSKFECRVGPMPIFGADGIGDFAQTAAQVPALIAAGVTVVSFTPFYFCKGPEDFEAFIDELVAL
jgi:alkanesulfonate monooxygenase SsuD/methylene tetrahydromethanopterin reductase-like flavin-dependent oxidoreductase (luciferase family)